MRWDPRVVLAALALILASCQGSGLDGGMGEMAPPVSQPGSVNGGMNGGLSNGPNGMAGPSIGPNGQEELRNPSPGSTLAPNEAQYAVGQAPAGMKCPTVTQMNAQFTCTLAFNIPAPSSSGSPKPSPTASPTPSPTPTASSDSDDSDDSDSPAPSPTPLGTITLQTEPLPKDVPAMTNPNPLFMRITPLLAIRLQSDTDFQLNGGATVQYTLPASQFAGRVFAVQLYNETVMRGRRADQFLASYAKFTNPQGSTVLFTFSVPKVTVRHTQIWLLALYGAQVPPGSTPTPSPSPSPSPSSSPSTSP